MKKRGIFYQNIFIFGGKITIYIKISETLIPFGL
jgi:hypothetical protein